MTSASSWRVTFLPYSGSNNVRMSEVHLLNADGSVDTNTHTLVVAGKASGWTDANIEDGNTNQSLEFDIGVSGGCSVIFNFTNAHTVDGIQIYSSNDTDGTAVSMAPVNLLLEWFNDVPTHPSSSGWIKDFAVTGGVWTADQQPQTFFKPKPGGGGGSGGPSGDGGSGGGVDGPPTLGPALIACIDDFVVDTITWAAGLRRLVNAWAGPLIRVRNPDNDIEFDVQQTYDGSLDKTLLLDDGFYRVVCMYDQTGLGSHIGQSTKTKQPTLYLSKTAVGGPAVWCDGATQGLLDVNGLSTTAPYMTANPNMFVISGAGLDGTQQTNFRPVMAIFGANQGFDPYNHPLSIQWYGDVGDSLIIVSAWGGINNTKNQFPHVGYKGWYGAALVPSLGAYWYNDTPSGSEASGIPAAGSATYGSNSQLAVMNDTYTASVINGGRRGYFIEGYIIDDMVTPTLADTNAWFNQVFRDVMLPNTIWRITVHDTFEHKLPSTGVYGASAGEIELANSPGGSNLALSSILTLGPNTTATNDNNAMFDGSLVATNISLDGNNSVADINFTFQPTLFESNVAVELRITTLHTNVFQPDKMYCTFKLERSTDDGATFVDLGEYDASLELDPPTDTYTYTFVIDNVHSDVTFDYKLSNPDVHNDVTFDYEIFGDFFLRSSDWRLLIHTNGGAGNCGFGEIEMHFDYGGTQLCTGGTAYASSADFGAAANALDGSPSTYWATSGVADNWWAYHFPHMVGVREISLTSLTAGGIGAAHVPKNFDMQYLDTDGVTWITAWSVVGATYTSDGETQTFADKAISDVEFDYAILAPFSTDVTFDYAFSFVHHDITFDYAFVTGHEAFNKDITFDYAFTPTVHKDLTVDYALSVIVGIRADVSFDYQLLPTFSLVGLPGLRSPPETPISETIGYSTNVIAAYDGTEQRSSLAQFAFRNVAFSFVVQNEDQRRKFMADFMAVSRGVCLVPQWQYGTNIAAADIAAEAIEYDPTTTDIRSGDYLYYITPQGYTGFFGQALNVNGSGAIVIPLLTALPKNSWVMPARKMHWGDGQGVQMQSIGGAASVSMSGLDLRSPMRQGQVTGLVNFFDGLPLLDKRPLAPADDLFSGGDLVLALAADLPTEIFSPARMPIVSGSRSFLAGRGQGLDFWREFVSQTAGARKPFLASSFRADLVPVAVSTDLLRVEGQDYLPLAGLPAYSRLAVETEAGTAYYKIIGAEALSGDTVIQTSEDITGTIKKISYLNQFRISDDVLRLSHDVMNVTVGFTVRTTNE